MSLVVSALVLIVAVSASGHAAAPPPQIPATFTNLQVLPKDIARPDLVNGMRSFALGLGVRCEHCHVGEGNDLSKFDFASDARPAKLVARKMMKMAAAINGDLLKGVGEPATTPKVTCYTCHRGAKTPLTAAPAGGGI
jgi:hypothetical protein